MPVKQFYLNAKNFDASNQSANSLVLELGKHHLACLVKNKAKNSIDAIEVFTFIPEESDDIRAVWNTLKGESSILNNTYQSTTLYVNNDLSVLVPSYKFTKEISDDYLQVVFGESTGFINHFEAIKVDPVIMNVFRVPSNWLNDLHQIVQLDSIKHTYSSLIDHATKEDNGTENLFVQFYHQHLIVCAVNHSQLILVQSFNYTNHDDVVYYLLNLSNQLNYSAQLTVHISGLIDLQSTMYTELKKYFENVVSGTSNTLVIEGDEQSFPQHYFTPFSKLVS